MIRILEEKHRDNNIENLKNHDICFSFLHNNQNMIAWMFGKYENLNIHPEKNPKVPSGDALVK